MSYLEVLLCLAGRARDPLDVGLGALGPPRWINEDLPSSKSSCPEIAGDANYAKVVKHLFSSSSFPNGMPNLGFEEVAMSPGGRATFANDVTALQVVDATRLERIGLGRRPQIEIFDFQALPSQPKRTDGGISRPVLSPRFKADLITHATGDPGTRQRGTRIGIGYGVVEA